MKLIVTVIMSLCLTYKVTSKKYGLCETVKHLLKEGVPKSDCPNWICLVKAASDFETDKKSGPHPDGTYDYGMFQISDNYCHEGSKGKLCNVACEDLMTSDITKSIDCAKTIKKKFGFEDWQPWVSQCKNKPLPDIHNC